MVSGTIDGSILGNLELVHVFAVVCIDLVVPLVGIAFIISKVRYMDGQHASVGIVQVFFWENINTVRVGCSWINTMRYLRYKSVCPNRIVVGELPVVRGSSPWIP